MERKEIRTEQDVARILHGKYPQPEWAFLTQVRNQTGFSRDVRTADALAMNLYPSRGFEVNGFEIKVSKSDLMHELCQPEKSQEIQRFCHRWWLVVNDPKIVENVQIPITWGVIDVSKGKCMVIKKAPELKAEPMSVEFIASLFRNVVTGFVHPEEVKGIQARAAEKAKWDMEHDYQNYEFLKNQVKDFEKESGIKISERYGASGIEIGKAVKFVLEGQQRIKSNAKCALDDVKRITEHLEKFIKTL